MICIYRRSLISSLLFRPYTSFPSKYTLPSVLSISRRRTRPRVDLPQPDSPTSPRVSPCRISREIPSKAFSCFVRKPSFTGKYFLTLSNFTSTFSAILFPLISEAAHHMILPYIRFSRHLLPTPLLTKITSAGKGTALGKLSQIGHRAPDIVQFFLIIP